MAGTCGDRYEPEHGKRWVCDLPAGHGTDHQGPAMSWTARRRPPRATWPRQDGQAPEARTADGYLDRIGLILADPAMTADAKVTLIRALLAGNDGGRGYAGPVPEQMRR